MGETEQKSWIGRNWLWVVPVGGCLTLIVLAVMGIGALFFGVSKMFTSSAPYEYALNEVKNNSEVINILGNPIEPTGIIRGNISLKNDDGEANFSIPIKGPNGKGSVTVIGTKTDGVWTYYQLYVTIKETQKEINLLKKDLEGI